MSKSLDRLALLETFVRIAERGSITAAAADLGISQASASRQLKALESSLGAVLIRRTTHSLSLTQAGQALLADARDLLAGWDSLSERYGDSEGEARGPLKVVAPVALGQGHLAEIAVRFQLAHPRVTLDWQLTDDPIRFAETGCDCWIKVGPVPDERLIVRVLGQVERLLVASPTLAARRPEQDPGSLVTHPCVALSPFEGGRIALRNARGEERMITPDQRLTTNNIFASYRAALLGIGFAVLPRWFVEQDLQSGMLVDLLPEWRAASLTINAAYAPTRQQPMRLRQFLVALQRDFTMIPGIEAAPGRGH